MSRDQGQGGEGGGEVERRRNPRYRAPEVTYADVLLPCGQALKARVLDASHFGGRCLVFDEDPKLEIGAMITVSSGRYMCASEVRHADQRDGEYRIGVRWADG
jgi:hypothetical protein